MRAELRRVHALQLRRAHIVRPGRRGTPRVFELVSAVGQAAIKAANSRAAIGWIIETPAKGEETAGAKLSGAGFVSACNPFGSIEEGSLIPFSATIRVSGKTTYTPATTED